MAIGIDQAIKAPDVLLAGASSQIGIFAIPRLLRAGFRVLAVSRTGRPQWYPVIEQLEWLSEADAVEASKNCQHLLSAGPMELAQKFLATGKQFQTAVVFSSSSVETKLESGDPVERSQIQSMLAIESQLRLTAENKGLKLVILRPTLIYGCGLDTNISRLANWIRRFGFMPVNGRAAGLRQPVHADDLASVAIAAMLSKDALPHILPLTGGDTLSYSDMLTNIFMMLGKPVRLVRLPEWLFVLLVQLANTFKIAGGINSEMVRRQKLDLIFDDRQARELLNYDPRPFAPVVEDFSLPVHCLEVPLT
jgi:nucleoside-diphosphate-sugar epimerase